MQQYASGVRFYREILGVSYEYGRHLREIGVLKPDAMIDGERPVFFCDPESVERHKQRICAYRATVRSAQENLVELV
jgi:hypothetical protein